ncbi:hypothetical protein DNHGIG_23780 [Collibacillus ludicampi]|uniref:Uncharacterized protein n=1 Tax=Collibacillus ludicampi TaxID=2771369 RepID=A0AAV4LG75_9BACL|nr:hypothetical protein [Collibacillus ludicampi]GIM46829.1 hypothetical protein DNHGIG_23780 [Collibacillus ludicampi]
MIVEDGEFIIEFVRSEDQSEEKKRRAIECAFEMIMEIYEKYETKEKSNRS